MKKLLILSLFFSSSAFAAGYGAAGCGLGSLVIGDKPGFGQVFAATTNGTSGSQTFGITSGTSNCAEGGVASSVKFIEANKVALSNDISRGSGETLSALGKMYGVKDINQMGSVLKAEYGTLFVANDATTIDKKIQTVLNSKKLL